MRRLVGILKHLCHSKVYYRSYISASNAKMQFLTVTTCATTYKLRIAKSLSKVITKLISGNMHSIVSTKGNLFNWQSIILNIATHINHNINLKANRLSFVCLLLLFVKDVFEVVCLVILKINDINYFVRAFPVYAGKKSNFVQLICGSRWFNVCMAHTLSKYDRTGNINWTNES